MLFQFRIKKGGEYKKIENVERKKPIAVAS
jgi:hypothetical protein